MDLQNNFIYTINNMKNLKEIQERYSKYFNGLGHVRWGGKSYYEVNSDIRLNLNSWGGNKGFVLNDLGEVELWDTREYYIHSYYYNGIEISEEEFSRLEDEGVSDDDLMLKSVDTNKTWGLTLDNYYPHPWYPEKKIKSFEIVNNIPFFNEEEIYDVLCGEIKSDCNLITYTEEQCLEYPEFFKPIYY